MTSPVFLSSHLTSSGSHPDFCYPVLLISTTPGSFTYPSSILFSSLCFFLCCDHKHVRNNRLGFLKKSLSYELEVRHGWFPIIRSAVLISFFRVLPHLVIHLPLPSLTHPFLSGSSAIKARRRQSLRKVSKHNNITGISNILLIKHLKSTVARLIYNILRNASFTARCHLA